ncbi:MAG: phosphatidylglycerol lysyltransferase domain-containing protein, partial [Eubacteriales bacterium]|nr:phosphatidylglycerol lysyltransferase domain-containing protein [Eubacteriales bacterium]
MQFHEITPADKASVQHCLAGETFENSELTFANMYMWRQGWGLRLAQEDGVIYMLSQHAHETVHFQPMVPRDKPVAAAVEAAMADLRQRGVPEVIVGANEDFRRRLLSETDAYDVQEDRDMSEYIYSVPDLMTLAGKKYHGKRNHVNKFRQSTVFAWRELGAKDGDECLAMFDGWAAQHDANEDITAEREAIEQAFCHFELLELTAAGMVIGDRLEAFAIGGMINPQLAVIHFEKGNAEIPGIYAAINQEFLQRHFAEVPFVNRQEDMGIPGLRKSKESYLP